MKRDIQKTLLKWKNHPMRMPLIVRGARQVGKTYIIEAFGNAEFKQLLTINLETSSKYKACFESLDPKIIIREIELVSNKKIIPGETLLFLDEIQQAPKALQALRYFKEKMPELHVIAAGSLLEFAIQDEEFSFPVGRVQFVRLYPLSFEEFLDALGENNLRQELDTFDLEHPPSSALHQHLIDRMREYFVVGGMPAAVQTFIKLYSFLEVKYIQKAIWDTYENDFGKYAPKAIHRHLRKIFHETPRLIGDHIKYSQIDPELPNPQREMKRAIELLKLAGLLHPVFATSAGDVPLMAGVNESIFKLLCLDIGLVEQAVDLDPQNPGMMTGPLAEQFVGQELLATGDALLETQLFFWNREKGTAEVDYLIAHKGTVFPIEVKAGKGGKLKSLHVFMQEKKSPLGIKISTQPLHLEKNILSIPLYLASHTVQLMTKAASPSS
ncbi:MAG: ATP-binding protein [Verrucomicrobia bacterium]|nr:ATP-binding protein [Verrucomicrobiota bacterium]